MQNAIQIRGARVHNLKNIDVDIPRNKLIVITGVSGSGKSSLAFDTLYAEGQRRYVESLSAYARQFLQRMNRPDVDEIRGISPAVAIQQKNPTTSSRSTVGTTTEIHDYLRLLYARIGRTICPHCHREVKKDQIQDVVDKILTFPEGTRIQIVFPLSFESETEWSSLAENLKGSGFSRVLLDKQMQQLDALEYRQCKKAQKIQVLVDRLQVHQQIQSRLADSLDVAFKYGNGKVHVLIENGEVLKFSQSFACAACGVSFIEPQPRLFSFNNPFGACPVCKGFGEIIELDMSLVISDPKKSLNQGAVVPWNSKSHLQMVTKMRQVAAKHDIDLDLPWCKLPEDHKKIIIEGESPFPGIKGFFRRLERKKYKIGVRVFLSRYRGFIPCPDCQMNRLRREALYVKINEQHIGDISRISIADVCAFLHQLVLTEHEQDVAEQILKELQDRLSYLVDVGLGYLTLDRRSQTLSGGEYQRINLATALGFKLVGSLYILDEPSIGLHPRDNERLIKILQALRNLGNTVVVVEHDRKMMEVSDQILDIGPGAGEHGGQMMYQGSMNNLLKNGVETLTAQYLKGEKKIQLPAERRKPSGNCIKIVGASENNLKHLTVEIPLGVFVAVSGVSGSGKSTLIHDTLYAGVARHFGKWRKRVGAHERIFGVEHLDGVVLVDQSPIGRTPRSNPVTYSKAFDGIRHLFAETRGAKFRQMTPGTFSFNTAGGRCETCEGAGVEKIEMQFLSDLYLQCEACGGTRYQKAVLNVRFKGKNIHDVLEMTVSEALEFFTGVQKITRKLKLLEKVGLGYLRLGQPATTLSGGEAQRLKLAVHLGEKKGKHQLYIFDEPTTGLHFDDIARLLQCLSALIEMGNSVIVIEHNLDVLKCADYIIDLGPEAGDEGGKVVTTGTPEQIARCPRSHTGFYLQSYLVYKQK